VWSADCHISATFYSQNFNAAVTKLKLPRNILFINKTVHCISPQDSKYVV